jgi:VanZ family protein
MNHQYDSSRPTLTLQEGLRFLFASSGLSCVVLVVYASIVPLDFTPLPWGESIDRWRTIPWLELGVWERADWIANTLIFVPPTFLMLGYLCTTRGVARWRLLLRGSLWIGFMTLLVLGIELIQIWFPPRTVSWNDVVAGIIGVWLGGFAWLWMGPWSVRWLSDLLQQPSVSTKATSVIVVAMLGCVLYSLYPFDLVLSVAELEEKRIQGRLRWWTDAASWGWLRILQSWTLAALRMVPFGLGLGWKTRPWLALFCIGILAALFELIQVPFFSKHAAGDEVLAGMCGGLAAWWIARNTVRWRNVLEYPGTWLLCAAIWIAIIPVAFLARSQALVTDPQAIADRWWGMLTPPLSRYYFTSEYSALTNLAGKLAMFGVLGLCIAGYSHSRHRRPHLRSILAGFWGAGLLGCVIEVLQVYFSPLIADLSDIFIYMVGYALGVLAGSWFFWDGTGRRGDSPTR